MSTTTFFDCLDDAIVSARGSKLPYICAYTASYSGYNGGIIHITGFKMDQNGDEYATYYLPSSSVSGRRYFYEIEQFQSNNLVDEDLELVAYNTDCDACDMDCESEDFDQNQDLFMSSRSMTVGLDGPTRWADM
jgi:hypothetical protein